MSEVTFQIQGREEKKPPSAKHKQPAGLPIDGGDLKNTDNGKNALILL